MRKIVECVPNFSEGRNKETIEAIATAIRNVDGISLIDVDPGESTNRTVYTFFGDPEAIIEGALAGARVARELIDMRKHHGEHPRFGAMDVCPFIPVAGVTMDDCVEIARRFAARAAEELGIASFLYEHAATEAYRRKLPDVRQGEYEGLKERLQDPRWKPDFGPTEFVPEWGASAVGARMFLIAYNVNLLATSNQAHRIALNLREAGRGNGKPGRLKCVKGMGWYVEEYKMAQVSVNLNDYNVTGIHTLFEAVKQEAEELGLGIAGSEIVGIVPLESLLMAADYYIEKEGLFLYEEHQKLRLVIERLGLNSVASFKPEERIVEYITAEKPEEPLASLSVRDLITEVAARSSAPGGGSVSAIVAALGAGLGSMVAKLTYGVRKFESVQGELEKAIPVLHQLTQDLIAMIDRDTLAFNEYMAGLRMPKKTDAEKAVRHEKMQAGLKTAVKVPLSVMRLAGSSWDALEIVAKNGNPASKSDTLVGAVSLKTGIWGAWQNVLINTPDIEDEPWKKEILQEAEAISATAEKRCEEILRILG